MRFTMRLTSCILLLTSFWASSTAFGDSLNDAQRQLDLEPIPYASPVINAEEWAARDLEAVPGLSHAYDINGRAGDTIWLAARSRVFPPVIVIARSGDFATPFGRFLPPEGLRRDRAGRPYSWTILDRDGWFVTRIEMSLSEDQRIKFLVGRAFKRPLRYGFGNDELPVSETGSQGGVYEVATAQFARD